MNPNTVNSRNDVHSVKTFATGLLFIATAICQSFAKLDPRRVVSFLLGKADDGAHKAVTESIPEWEKNLSEVSPMEPRKGYITPILSIFRNAGYFVVTAAEGIMGNVGMQASLKAWTDLMTTEGRGLDALYLGTPSQGTNYRTYVVDSNALAKGQFSATEHPALCSAILVAGRFVRPALNQGTGAIEYIDAGVYLKNPERASWEKAKINECHSRIASLALDETDKNAIVASLLEQAPVIINTGNLNQPKITATGTESVNVLVSNSHFVVTRRSAPGKGFGLYRKAELFRQTPRS